MPDLPYSIELHDSRVSAIAFEGGIAIAQLRPAYIHRDGKGWSQDADIIIRESSVGQLPEFPATIADGSLRTEQCPYHNLLYLPLAAAGPVSLELELFSGSVIKVHGNSVEVVLLGEPVFVEEVTGRI
jgi:hypothetical protein